MDTVAHRDRLAALEHLIVGVEQLNGLQTDVVALEPVVALDARVVDEGCLLRLGGEVQRDALVHVAVEDDLALVQHDAAVTQVADRRHVVADVEHGLAVAPGGLAHLGQALFLELHVTDGEDLVHDHNFAVQMGGNGECQFHEHAAGIALDRRVDKVADLGELNNFRHLGVNFGAGHT